MAGRKIRDANEARALLVELDQSNLDVGTFAGLRELDGRSLNAWRLNLRRRSPATSELRVVEVFTTPPPGGQPPGVTVRCGPFAVDVTADVSDDLLARVFALVASC